MFSVLSSAAALLLAIALSSGLQALEAKAAGLGPNDSQREDTDKKGYPFTGA